LIIDGRWRDLEHIYFIDYTKTTFIWQSILTVYLCLGLLIFWIKQRSINVAVKAQFKIERIGPNFTWPDEVND
jgi:hypothetical protein